jgi:phage shock protein E
MNLFKQFIGNGGVPALAPQEAQAKLGSDQPPFLLDVREAYEYQAEHIAGATLIPLGELSARADKLPRDREILCVCQSGSRSSVAARQLVAAGFKSLNLSGGMSAWRRAGLPIKKGSAR